MTKGGVSPPVLVDNGNKMDGNVTSTPTPKKRGFFSGSFRRRRNSDIKINDTIIINENVVFNGKNGAGKATENGKGGGGGGGEQQKHAVNDKKPPLQQKQQPAAETNGSKRTPEKADKKQQQEEADKKKSATKRGNGKRERGTAAVGKACPYVLLLSTASRTSPVGLDRGSAPDVPASSRPVNQSAGVAFLVRPRNVRGVPGVPDRGVFSPSDVCAG